MLSLQTYTDPQELFELQVPVDWLQDASGQMGTRVVFMSPQIDSGFKANVNVMINQIAPLTRDEFLILSRLQLKMASGAAKLPIDQAAEQPPGTHVFEWINKQAPIRLRVRQQVFFAGERAFVLSATAPAVNFKTYLDTFESIFRAFRVKDNP